MNVGAGHAAVGDISHDGDIQIFEVVFAVQNSEGVEKRLSGVFVGAVAGVDYGDVKARGGEISGSGSVMAHDDGVGLHGFEGKDGIEKRFALFQAGALGLKKHDVRAQTRAG